MLPYSLSSSCNKEFPFPGAQINVVGKTENPEHLAVLKVVEPVGGKHMIYTHTHTCIYACVYMFSGEHVYILLFL